MTVHVPAPHCCPTCGAALADDATIRIDVSSGIVVAKGRFAALTQREFALFDALWTARPKVLSKEQLLKATADAVGFDDRELKIVDVFVCKARKKLKAVGIEIETIWGQGYRIIGGNAK